MTKNSISYHRVRFLSWIFLFFTTAFSNLFAETLEWWKIIGKDENGSHVYTVYVEHNGGIVSSPGGYLDEQDLSSGAITGLWIVNQNDEIVTNRFDLLVSAQNGLLAMEDDVRNWGRVPSSMWLKSTIDKENPEDFYVPVTQVISDEDYLEDFILNGWAPYSDVSAWTSGAVVLDGIRDLGSFFAHGGVGLTPDLTRGLFYELLWEVYMYNEEEDNSVRDLAFATAYIGAEQGLNLARSFYEYGLEEATTEIISEALKGTITKEAAKASVDGFAHGIELAFLLKEIGDLKQEMSKEAMEQFALLPFAADFSEQVYSPIFRIYLNNGENPNIGWSLDNPLLSKYFVSQIMHIRNSDIPAFGGTFDNFYNEFYKLDQGFNIAEESLKAALGTTVSALAAPTGPFAGYIGSLAADLGGVLSTGAGKYTQGYYDAMRAALCLNIHLAIRRYFLDQNLDSLLYDGDEISSGMANQINDLIVFDRFAITLMYEYLTRHFNQYASLREDIPSKFSKQNALNESAYWKSKTDDMRDHVSSLDKVVGVMGADYYISLLKLYSESEDKLFALAERTLDYVPSGVEYLSEEPVVTISPSAVIDFGNVIQGTIGYRSVSIHLTNDTRPFTWSAMINDPSGQILLPEADGSVFGRQVLELKVGLEATEVGPINGVVSLQLLIPARYDFPEQSITLEVSVIANGQDPLDCLLSGNLCDYEGVGSVDDGSLGSSWDGESETFMVGFEPGNGVTSRGLVRFNLPEMPEGYRVVDAYVDLPIERSLNLTRRDLFATENYVNFEEDVTPNPIPGAPGNLISTERINGNLTDADNDYIRVSGSRFDALVEAWMKNPSSNYGLLLWPSSELDKSLRVYLHASESPTSTGPQLTVQLQRNDSRRPRLIITEPSRQSYVDGTSVMVRGYVSDENGIEEVLINGGSIGVSTEGSDEISFSKSVSLSPGANTITVEAVDGAVEENRKARTITVYRPDFDFYGAQENYQVRQGEEAELKLFLDRRFGFDEVVYISTQVNGLNVVVADSTVSPAESVDMTVNVPASLPRAVYELTVTGTAAGLTRKAVIPIQVIDGYAPEIELSRPTSDVVYTTATEILVEGTATDIGTSGLKKVYMENANSQESVISNSGTNENFSFTVPLVPGKNFLVIKAQDNDWNLTTDHIEVYVELPPEGTLGLQSPADGATAVPTDMTLTWNPLLGAGYYRVYWSTDAGMIDAGIGPEEQLFVEEVFGTELHLTDLQKGAEYFVRIEGINDYGTVSSITTSFKTLSEGVLALWNFGEVYSETEVPTPVELTAVDTTGSVPGGMPLSMSSIPAMYEGLLDAAVPLDHLAAAPQVTLDSLVGLPQFNLSFWMKGGLASAGAGSFYDLVSLDDYILQIDGANTLRLKWSILNCTLAGVPADEWVYVNLSFDYTQLEAKIRAFFNGQWNESTLSFPASMPALTQGRLDIAEGASFTEFAIAMDELSLTEGSDLVALAEEWLSYYQANVRFNYTVKIVNRYGGALTGDITLGTVYNEEVSQLVTDRVPPGEYVLSVQVPGHTFFDETITLPWRDFSCESVSTNDPPFGLVVSGDGYGTVGNPVQLQFHAFDDYVNASTTEMNPRCIRIGPDGALYVADVRTSSVYRMNMSGGTLTTIELIAGNGTSGYSGDGGLATEASLSGPEALAWDTTGNLYIADRNNHRVRKVAVDGTITTVLGNGTTSSRTTPASGAGISNALTRPSALAFKSGILYVSDEGRDAVLRLDGSGNVSIDTQVTEIQIGVRSYLSGSNFTGIGWLGSQLIGSNTHEFILNLNGGASFSIWSGVRHLDYNGDGLTPVRAAYGTIDDMVTPANFSFGDLFIVDGRSKRFRVYSGGLIKTLAGSGSTGYPFAGQTVDAVSFRGPSSMDTDGANVFLADESGGAIFRMGMDGTIQPFYESSFCAGETDLWYQLDYGDGRLSDWANNRTLSATWYEAGLQSVRIRAKDAAGLISGWSLPYPIMIQEGVAAATELNAYTVYSDDAIAAGETVIVRDTTLQIGSANFTIPDGATLILDNAAMFLPEDGTLTLTGTASIYAYNNSFLLADNINSNQDANPDWWADTDAGILELYNSYLFFRNADLDLTRFISSGSELNGLGRNGILGGVVNGEDVSLKIYSNESLKIHNDSAIVMEAGEGAEGISNYQNGGNGGNLTFDLRSRNQLLLEGRSRYDLEIELDAGDGGEGGGSGGYPGTSGHGGSFFMNLEGYSNLTLAYADFYLQGGRGADGNYAGGSGRPAGRGGNSGPVDISLSSQTGDVYLVVVDMNVDGENGGDAGDTENTGGAVGGYGSSVTFSVESTLGALSIESSDLDFACGIGGDGGDGESAASGSAGGTGSFLISAELDIQLRDFIVDMDAGNGGRGGYGEGEDSADTAQAGAGGVGGDVTSNIMTNGSLYMTRADVEIHGGDGGTPGNPNLRDGAAAGAAGSVVMDIGAGGHFQSISTLIDFTGGLGEDGSDGDDSYSDGGGAASSGGSATLNLTAGLDISILDSTEFDIRGNRGGTPGSGDNSILKGGSGGHSTISIISETGGMTIISSSLETRGGDGDDGSYTYESSGGPGGNPGLAKLKLTLSDSLNVSGESALLLAKGGDGGDGGQGRGGSGGTPVVGGQGLIQIDSPAEVLIKNGAQLTATGGEGGNGEDGETDSRDSNGATGGEGRIAISADEITVDFSSLTATGGEGGAGEDRNAGAAGTGAIVLAASSQGSVFDSEVLALAGKPGQNDLGIYAGQPVGTVTLTGITGVEHSTLGNKVVASNDMVLADVWMETSSYLTSNRNLDLRNASKLLSGFVTTGEFGPKAASQTWTMTYNAGAFNWQVSGSLDGTSVESLEFEKAYFFKDLELILGNASFFTWNNGDWVQFTDRQPAVETINGATVTLYNQIESEIQYPGGEPYVGPADFITLDNGADLATATLTGTPFFASTPGYTVSGTTFTALPTSGLQVIASAPGWVSDPVDILTGVSPVVFQFTVDSDRDLLSDLLESIFGTDPLVVDTDGDGLSDWEEVVLYYGDGANPLSRDSDGDGSYDAEEIANGTGIGNASDYVDRNPTVVSTEGYLDALPAGAAALRQMAVMSEPAGEPEVIEAETNQLLGVAVETFDPDGEFPGVEYRWIRNGVVLSGALGSELESAYTTKGDEIQVEVRATSGPLSSDWQAGAGFLIVNAAPTMETLDELISCYIAEKAASRYEAMDKDNDPVTLQLSDPANGTLILEDGRIVYSPDLGFYGFDAFTVQVFDDSGAASTLRTVTVEVQFVSEDPFEEWVSQYLDYTEFADIAVSGDEANTDGDRFGLYREFLYGLNPTMADPVYEDVVFNRDAGSNTIQFLLNGNAGQIQPVLEQSGELSTWQAVVGAPAPTIATTARYGDWWEIEVNEPDTGKSFYRIRYKKQNYPAAVMLSVDTASLNPDCLEGEDAASDTIAIWNGASGNMAYSLSTDADWITLIPSSGSSSGEHDLIQVVYTTSHLAVGAYSAQITVTAPGASGSPHVIDVTITVNEPPAEVSVSTTSLSPSCTVGEDAPATSFEVWNSGGGELSYSISTDVAWLDFSPDGGGSTGLHDLITVTYATSGLAAGTYSGEIYVDSMDINNPSVEVISVTLAVNEQPPVLNVDTSTFSPSCNEGEDAQATTFELWNSGGGEMSFSVGVDVTWILLSPQSGTSSGEHQTINVTYDTDLLTAGIHSGTITVSGGGNSHEVQVDLNVLILSQDLQDASLNYFSLDGNVLGGGSMGLDGINFGATPTLDRNNNPSGAMYFDGNSYIRVSGYNWNSGNFAVAMWVKANELPSWYKSPIAIHSGTGSYVNAGDKQIMLVQASDGNFVGWYNSANAGTGGLSAGILDLSDWTHVVFQREGNIQEIYINGELVDTITDSKGVLSFSNGLLEIGAPNFWQGGWTLNGRGGAKWLGSLDEIFIFDRKLTIEEIQILSNP